MDIPIDVEVHCADGPVGHSSAIVLNPVTKEVTHLAVRTKGLLSDEYLVPVELIAESTPQRISLSCSRAELAQCQPFEKSVLVGVDGAELGPSDMDYAMAATYGTMPGGEYPGAMYPPTLQEEQIPDGTLSIHPGASVEATDGHVGQVREFIIDPQNDRVTHLVLREGHLWGKKDVTIPLDQIERIEEDVIFLKLDKADVERLPSVRAR
jgi:sporulation protein YlmC with PRC-barrel domain